MKAELAERISIQPEVGMYAAFARLNYKPWFALGEFVDNAVQSHVDNATTLGARLEVDIDIDESCIRISDNAAGIAWKDFVRAFTPAAPPANRKGLSEFGLGMKAAACWFAAHWSVRTKTADDTVERQVIFDIPTIVSGNLHELGVIQNPSARGKHYTVIELTNLRVKLQKKTLGKIKSHLESIYRRFLEDQSLTLTLRYPSGAAHKLAYDRPQLLEAPHYKKPDGPDVLWRKEFQVDLKEGRAVNGWAGLLKVGSVSTAGFSVFRRKRLIQGSHDETYRPEEVFKKANSYVYQRLVGELSCKGFQVSHTKDGIDWGGDEDQFLDELVRILDSADMPLLRQAENYKARQAAKDLNDTFGTHALEQTAHELANKAPPIIESNLPPVGEEVEDLSPALFAAQAGDGSEPSPLDPPQQIDTPVSRWTPKSYPFEFSLPGRDGLWKVRLDIVKKPGAPWYTPEFASTDGGAVTNVVVALNVDHPFSEQFVNNDEASLGVLIRIVAALSIAEVTARKSGVKHLDLFRKSFNDLLQDALVSPDEVRRTSDG